MAKKGMKHYCDRSKVPPLIPDTVGNEYHAAACASAEKIPAVFPAIDNDLAVENIQNDFDMTAADRQDLAE